MGCEESDSLRPCPPYEKWMKRCRHCYSRTDLLALTTRPQVFDLKETSCSGRDALLTAGRISIAWQIARWTHICAHTFEK